MCVCVKGIVIELFLEIKNCSIYLLYESYISKLVYISTNNTNYYSDSGTSTKSYKQIKCISNSIGFNVQCTLYTLYYIHCVCTVTVLFETVSF